MNLLTRLWGHVAHWATTAHLRRGTYLVLAIVLGILSLWPQPHLAKSRFVAQDTTNAAGISTLMGALGGQQSSVASILGGGRPSNDMYMIIGRSDSVEERVIRLLNLVGSDGFSTHKAAKRYLERNVEVNMLLGGVMEIDAKTWDADTSMRLAKAYVTAMSNQLADFAAQLMENKRRIVDDRFAKAKVRLAASEKELTEFRRANRLPAPEDQLGTELALRTSLQAQLDAKEIELDTLREFNGPENPAIRSVQGQIASLRQKLNETAVATTSVTGPNLAQSSEIQSAYLDLYRKYLLAQGLYQIYSQVMEQVELDKLASETATYVQVIDPPFLDINRNYNLVAVALLILVIVMAAFTELYGPWTGLFDLDADRRKHEAAEQ